MDSVYTTFRRGLDLLKAEERVIVYRGGNQGLDQKTVARDYTIGRPIQWAAFSSTTISPSGVRLFVRKNEGKWHYLKLFAFDYLRWTTVVLKYQD